MANPDETSGLTFVKNFTLMTDLPFPAQNILGRLSQLSAVSYVNTRSMTTAQAFDSELMILKPAMHAGIDAIQNLVSQSLLDVEVARYDRDYTLPIPFGVDPEGYQPEFARMMFLRVGQIYYAFDKIEYRSDGIKSEDGFNYYRYRGWFSNSWMVLLTMGPKCDEWFNTKIRDPLGNAYSTQAIDTVDFGLKIFLPGYAGADKAFIQGKPVEGTMEAIASFALMGAGRALTAGATGLRRATAWTAIGASTAQATVVIYSGDPTSSRWDLVGPALTGAIALPMTLKIEWVKGGWRIVNGWIDSLPLARRQRLQSKIPDGIIKFLDDAELIYKSKLTGNWDEDMPTIMAMVRKHRNGKGLDEISDIEFEGIKHSYDGVVATIRREGRPLSDFATLMQENLDAGSIWSFLNKSLTGSKGGGADLQGHAALGRMIADLGITPDTLPSVQAQLAANPRLHREWLTKLRAMGWQVGFVDAPNHNLAWSSFVTALKGFVRGFRKPSFDTYRLATLDANGTPRLYAGAAAAGRTADDVAGFAGQFEKSAEEAGKLKFVILRFPAGTVPSTRINGRGKIVWNVENTWAGGVANEQVILTKSASDVKFTKLDKGYSAEIPHKAGGKVKLDCIPVMDVMQ